MFNYKKELKKITYNSFIYNLIINNKDFFGLNRLKDYKKVNQKKAILFIANEIANNMFNPYKSDYKNYDVNEEAKRFKSNGLGICQKN
jgi:hypothetical protein